MTRDQNGIRNRNPIRTVLFILALGSFSLTAQAATLSGWGSAGMSSNGGKSWTMSPGGAAGDLRVPVKTPGGGWQTAGNYGVQNGATGTTFRLGADGQVFRSMPDGTTIKYPAHIEAPLSVGDLAGAAAGFIGGPLGIACMIACPALIDWMGTRMRWNPDTKQPEMQSGDQEFQSSIGADKATWYPTESQACKSTLVAEGYWKYGPFSWGGGQCASNRTTGPPDNYNERVTAGIYSRVRQGPANWLPASMDDIAPYMSARPRPSPNVVGEILNQGGNIPLPTTDTTVTGPTSVTGPVTSTINADGTRTTSSTRYNFTTSGGTVNNTTNQTTTITYNTDNSVRSTVTTTTTPTDETGGGGQTEPTEQEDPCKANPDRIGCMEQDVPDGEIPRTQKDITFAPEDVLGTGSCPADVTASFGSAPGLTGVKLLNWQGFCDAALPLRAIIIAMASIMAFFIVMPGGRVE